MRGAGDWWENLDLLSVAVLVDKLRINSFLACGDICRLQITFVNCLDPDQN